VCGGRDGNTIVNSCESYSHATNTWTLFPAMPDALEGNAMSWFRANSGRLYLISFGGFDASKNSDTNAM
jgi:hypothetical protein